MSGNACARWLSLLVLLSVVVVSPPASAAPSCAPSTAAFCVDFSSSVTSPGTLNPLTDAVAPADLHVVLANSSATRRSDASLWWDHLTLTGFSGSSAPRLTPSALLPNGLLLAGGTAGCGNESTGDFSSCSAGYGSALIFVSGTGGFADGVRDGSFGIQRIESINPPSMPGAVIDDLITVRLCANTLIGVCSLPSTASLHLVGLPGTGNDPGPITVTTRATYDYNYGPAVAHADGSLDSLTLNLHGTSTQLSDGTSVAKVTTLTLPRTCGFNVAGVSVGDRGGASIALPMPFTTGGCPVAALTDTETAPLQVTLDGAGSSTPLAGRTVSHWHWTFGDGTAAVTDGPVATHTYSTPGARTVALQVEDSLGALSPVLSRHIAGTTLTLATSPTSSIVYGAAARLSGVLRTSNTTTGLGSRTINLLRCSHTFTACVKISAVVTSNMTTTRGQYAFSVTPAANTGYRTEYAGGAHQIGARVQALVTVRPTVAVAASATTLSLGGTSTLSGAVGPNRAGHPVYLQRWSGYAWSTVATRTLTSASCYSFVIRPTSRGASYYQVTYPADSTHLTAVSHPVTLQTN